MVARGHKELILIFLFFLVGDILKQLRERREIEICCVRKTGGIGAKAQTGNQDFSRLHKAEIGHLLLHSSKWSTASLDVLTKPESNFNKISQVSQMYIKFEEHCCTEAGYKEGGG